jgi:hypothetical protein
LLDALSVYQHHDAITGTDAQYVANDYSHRLSVAAEETRKAYHAELEEELERQTGLKAGSGLAACVGYSNDTVIECP